MPAAVARRLDGCIRCGLCLPACPTYAVFRTEMDAPRGRLALMRAVWEGRAAAAGAVEEHLDLCLGCLACETACPSGVEYGALLHATRERREPQRARTVAARLARWVLLRHVLPRRRVLRALSAALAVSERLGLLELARHARWLPAGPRRLAALVPDRPRRFRVPPAAPASASPAPPPPTTASLAPPPSPPASPSVRAPSVPVPPRGLPAQQSPSPAPSGERRAIVALFRGCVQDALLGEVNAATVRVLERHGFEVRVPPGQSCCGAAAYHAGETALARETARCNLAAFDSGDHAAVVSNAGGCGAMLAGYGSLFEGDPAAGCARRFAETVRDVSQLLAGSPTPVPAGRVEARATYVDSCHLRHAQGVADPPRALLRRIPGLELVELERPDDCCGSAGLYNLTHGETADAVLDRKLADVRATGASLVVTTNPGCQLQLLDGVRRAGLEAEVVHLVELLERSHAAAG